MEDQGENFDQLQKLLSLKRHEVPPPGYFNRLPGEIVSQLRAERQAGRAASTSESDAPWLLRAWNALAGRPMFAGAFGAVACSLILAGIYLADGPNTAPGFATQQNQPELPFIAAAPEEVSVGLGSPLLLAATNNMNEPTAPNLFDLAPQLQVAPVADRPNY